MERREGEAGEEEYWREEAKVKDPGSVRVTREEQEFCPLLPIPTGS
jgi:hypothetical protein